MQHTSVLVILTENSDRNVFDDLEGCMENVVSDGKAFYSHRIERPYSLPSYIRSVFTGDSLLIPAMKQLMGFGVW